MTREKNKWDIQPLNRGQWKYIDSTSRMVPSNERVQCSVCKNVRSRLVGDTLNFCPNCGAKMESEE